mgnify:CR=1 FL=1
MMTCRNCGGVFKEDLSKHLNRAYCSRACQNEDLYSTDYSPLPMPDLSEGNCVGIETNLMFPKRGTRPYIKRMCQTCPVVQACGEYGLRVKVEGVWGGMNTEERKQLAKQKHIVREPLTFDYILQMQFTRSDTNGV